ncbi:MAG: ATP-binding protein [Ghiorsea sp.]
MGLEKLSLANGGYDFTSMLGAETDCNCPKHGAYVGYEKSRDCGKCIDERSQLERKDKAREQRKAVLAYRWEKCGMAKKFCGIEMQDWIADDDKQRAVKTLAKRFVSGEIKRMMMVGNCGTGKTMLAAAAIGEMATSSIEPLYITATRLIRCIRDSWKQKDVTEQDVMDTYILADVLVVDELGAGRCSEDDKLILSEIVCDRYANDMPTMLISNMNTEAIKASVLDDRAYDRMREQGKLAVLQGESKRGRAIA